MLKPSHQPETEHHTNHHDTPQPSTPIKHAGSELLKRIVKEEKRRRRRERNIGGRIDGNRQMGIEQKEREKRI